MEQPTPWVYMGLAYETESVPQQVRQLIGWVVADGQEEAEQVFRARIRDEQGPLSKSHGTISFVVTPLPQILPYENSETPDIAGFALQLVPKAPDEIAPLLAGE